MRYEHEETHYRFRPGCGVGNKNVQPTFWVPAQRVRGLTSQKPTSASWALHVNLSAPKSKLRLSSSSGERVLIFVAYFSRFFAKVGDWVSIAFAAPRLPPFNRQQILNFFPLLHGQPAFGS